MLAENYLQHAEHYSRIIMAYREQLNPQGEGMNGNGQRMRMPGEMGDDEFGDDDGSDAGEDGLPQALMPQPAPRHDGTPSRRQPSRGPARWQQPARRQLDDNNRQDRPFRRDQGRNRERFATIAATVTIAEIATIVVSARIKPRRRPAASAGASSRIQAADGGNDPRRRDRFQQPHEQPEFLRRPVRRARTESDEDAEKDETSRD